MKRLFSSFLVILALLLTITFADAKGKGHGHDDGGPKAYKITQVDPASITVSLGESGETHEVFAIDGKTIITIDGAPATPSDLKAGMKAKIQAGPDNKAISIHAGEAAAHPSKGRVG